MNLALSHSQAKGLAGFCFDMAKGVLLSALASPFLAKDSLEIGMLLLLINSLVSLSFLKFAIDLLEEVKD